MFMMAGRKLCVLTWHRNRWHVIHDKNSKSTITSMVNLCFLYSIRNCNNKDVMAGRKVC